MYFSVDVGCSVSYVKFDFIAQIAENTFILHWKKVKTGIADYLSPAEIKIKIAASSIFFFFFFFFFFFVCLFCFVLFFKPTPIFSDAEVKVVRNSIVRFFKICL